MKPGDEREVLEISDSEISIKLLEMGCLPGTKVVFNYRAPFGDPICVTIGDYDLSLRRLEAGAIVVN